MDPLSELRHSIKTHLIVAGGPSPQLCVFLIKAIDFLDDTDAERRTREMNALAFSIVEAIAIRTYRSIDDHLKQATSIPSPLQLANDNILLVLGKVRKLPDIIAAKNAVLGAVAESLRVFSEITNTKLMTLTTCDGRVL